MCAGGGGRQRYEARERQQRQQYAASAPLTADQSPKAGGVRGPPDLSALPAPRWPPALTLKTLSSSAQFCFLRSMLATFSNECIWTSPGKYLDSTSANMKPLEKSLQAAGSNHPASQSSVTPHRPAGPAACPRLQLGTDMRSCMQWTHATAFGRTRAVRWGRTAAFLLASWGS